ncbi:RrF2 family transcriptional regulator [Glycomyces buryatensis]|uniref:Rrf2 family transcriptional regulator n=1 Tax=Glycomyces buryatensis TaxID=2570927 RepID=A0A4S8Q5Y6_9ACTN|nr:Rrf2 family transcriptional regulator [Glycomyces buryatensis]THV39510.1 Rrf2 family transcriptional regulator [Glycomyces buryatensis]
MKINEGVEWAAHCCLLLNWMEADGPVSTARLAAGYGLPPAYLNKQLQPLVKAGVLTSTAGKKGGFRLAKGLGDITLMDILTAIEGPDEAFKCAEIRQAGVWADLPASAFRAPCAIDTAMRSAELEWRRALAAQTLAQVQANAELQAPGLRRQVQDWYAAR